MAFCKFKLSLVLIVFNFFFSSQAYIYQFDIWTKWDEARQSHRYMYGLYDCHIDFQKQDKEIGNEQWRFFIHEFKKHPKHETVCIIESHDTRYNDKKQFLHGACYAINTIGYTTFPIDYRNKSSIFIDICVDLYESNQKLNYPFKITNDDAYNFLIQSDISFYSLMREIETAIKEIEDYNDPQILAEWYKEQIEKCLHLLCSCIHAYLKSIYISTYSLQIPFWQFLSDDRDAWGNFLVAVSRLVDCKAMHKFFNSKQKYMFIIMGGSHLKNCQSIVHTLGWELLFSHVGKEIYENNSKIDKTSNSWQAPKPSQEAVPYELFTYISDHSKIPKTDLQTKLSEIIADHDNNNKQHYQLNTFSLEQFTKELENKEFSSLPCLKTCIRFFLAKPEQQPFHFFIKKIDERIHELRHYVKDYQIYHNEVMDFGKKEETHSRILDFNNNIDALTKMKQEVMNFEEFIDEQKNKKNFFQWLVAKILLKE
jgi:hypothetical protein